MFNAHRHRAFSPAFLFAVGALTAISVSGCGVPLAPGYQIQKESLSVHFISSNPPHLAIRADYRLANTGNSPLHFIPCSLPGEKDFGLANVAAQIDGTNVAPQHNPNEAAENWRIPLASPLRQKQKINLTLSYDLAASTPTDPRIFVATNMFYLNASGWFPAFMSFKTFLSPGVTRPNRIDFSVVVPSSFRATASGEARGEQKHASETEYRFRIGKADFNPYVLAGQYNEQSVSASGTTVIFWSFAPFAAAQSEQIAAQISAALKFYSQNFSAFPKSIHAARVIVIPAAARSSSKNGQFIAPPATIIQSADSRPNSQSYALNPLANSAAAAQLAGTWFSHAIRARPEAWMLSSALAHYASTQFAEANGASRRDRIASTLADYNRLTAQAVEKPVLSLTQTDPAAQRQLGFDKMQLFFVALEDKCGRQNVIHAIHDMVYALRGEDYGYNDFRAALEQQCRQNLDGFFRIWLAQPGIPPDFRPRYENAGGAHLNSQ